MYRMKYRILISINYHFQCCLYKITDLAYLTTIDSEMCRATYWKWKRNRRHKSSLFANIPLSPSPPRQRVQKNHDVLFSLVSQGRRQDRRKSGFGRQNVLLVNHNFVSQRDQI